jgi:hypothetical protein
MAKAREPMPLRTDPVLSTERDGCLAAPTLHHSHSCDDLEWAIL